MSDEPPQDDNPLDHVVDDLGPREDALNWACGEMERGRTPEGIAADLLEQGWDAESAESIAEEARQRTRHLRGVRTREDVAQESEQRYRRTMRMSWLTGFPQLGAAWKLLTSLSYVFGSRRDDSEDREQKGK